MNKKLLNFFLFVIMICSIVSIISNNKTNTKAINENYNLTSQGAGYLYNTQSVDLNNQSAVSISFDIISINNLGAEEIGFALVNEEEATDNYLIEPEDTGYSKYGKAALYGSDGMRFLQEEPNTMLIFDDKLYDKENIFLEGKTIKATFDIYEGSFILESKNSDSVIYETIQKIENLQFPMGKAFLGLQFFDSISIVIKNISFMCDFSDSAIKSIPLKYSDSLKVEEGSAYSVIEADGYSYLSNETPQDIGNQDIIFTIRIIDFTIEENSSIGFCIGTKTENGKMYGGEKGMMFSLDNTLGFKQYLNNYDNYTYIDGDLNIPNLFLTGVQIKAIFSPTEGSFKISVKWSEESPFFLVQKITGLDLPSENVYCGMQFTGNTYIKTSYYSVYSPGTPQSFNWENSAMIPIAPLSVQNGGKKFVLPQTVANSVPSGYYITQSYFNVNDDESVAIIIDSLHDVKNESPSGDSRVGFTFTNSVDTPVWLYAFNTSYTMFYEGYRATCYLKYPQDSDFLSLGDSMVFFDVMAKGNSIMAVFTPQLNIFSLFLKKSGESDYSLAHQYRLPSKYIDKTKIYAGFSMYGGMTVEADSIKSYKIKTNHVLDYKGYDLRAEGLSISGGGEKIISNRDGYIYTENDIKLNEKDVAIEYNNESFNFTGGTYNIGYLLSSDFKENIEPEDNDNNIFLSFLPSNDLTSSVFDRMRSIMFKDGYTVRMIFHTGQNKYSLQYKKTDTYTWMTFLTRDIEGKETFNFLNDINIALRIQSGAELNVGGIKIYLLDKSEEFQHGIKGAAQINIKQNTSTYTVVLYCNNSEQGKVYLSDNDALFEDYPTFSNKIDEYSDITLNAEPLEGYIFEGWYKDEIKVSQNTSFSVNIKKDETYTAVFKPATLIYIQNGIDSNFSNVSNYYENGKTLGVFAEKAPEGYSFTGWTISIVEEQDQNINTVQQYTVVKKNMDFSYLRNNLLGSFELYGWEAIANDLSDTGVYPISKQGNYNTVKLNDLIFLDKEGLSEGTLMIIVPDTIKSDRNEQNQITVKRYIKLQANYESIVINNNKTIAFKQSDDYIKSMMIIKTVDIILICAASLSILSLIIVKLKKTKK